MPEQSGERTQDATPFRRQQAREKGQVAQSQDLGSATLLIAGVLVLMTTGTGIMQFIALLLKRQLGGQAWLTIDRSFLMSQWHSVIDGLTVALLPALALMMGVAILSNVLQIGLLWVPSRLAPDLSRISPLAGFRRIFALAGVMRLAFGLFKIMVVMLVAFWALYEKQAEILALTELGIGQIALYMIDLALWTSLKVGIALLILALLDYAYQRWKHEQDLKMTQQEVRDEMKNLQGDPQVLARRRQVQRQLVLNRLSDIVPKADVVVTNPTELAIAIQYDADEMLAPVVIAKGAGVIAQRIRRLALENNIPIVEKKPLARELYRDVEVNHPVPHKLYAAVAEVLAYVYQLKGKPLPGSDAA